MRILGLYIVERYSSQENMEVLGGMTTQQRRWIDGPASILRWTMLRRYNGWRRCSNALLAYTRLLVSPGLS
jgi:hypothetical protein